jgi:hypothetical protein
MEELARALLEGATGLEGVGILLALTNGQMKTTTAMQAVATLVARGHGTGGLGLVARARRTKTTMPMNQTPAKRMRPIPNPSPKTAGLLTPRLTILIPIARKEPSKKQVQIAAAPRQKR